MGQSKEFNLRIKIAAFIQQLNDDGIITETEQDEIWDHFYCEVDELTKQGFSEQEAFETCISHFGSQSLIKQEYEKERPGESIKRYTLIGFTVLLGIEMLTWLAATLSYVSNLILSNVFSYEPMPLAGTNLELSYLILGLLFIGGSFWWIWHYRQNIFGNSELYDRFPTIVFAVFGIQYVYLALSFIFFDKPFEANGVFIAINFIYTSLSTTIFPLIVAIASYLAFKNRHKIATISSTPTPTWIRNLLYGFTFYFGFKVFAVSLETMLRIASTGIATSFHSIPWLVNLLPFFVIGQLALAPFLFFKGLKHFIRPHKFMFVLPICALLLVGIKYLFTWNMAFSELTAAQLGIINSYQMAEPILWYVLMYHVLGIVDKKRKSLRKLESA